MNKVVFGFGVSVDFIKKNVDFDFEFEGSGVYEFVGGSGEIYGYEKISNNNEVELMNVDDILNSIVDEDFSEKDINKLKEFVFSDFDDDLGCEKMRYVCCYGEDDFREYYYVK